MSAICRLQPRSNPLYVPFVIKRPVHTFNESDQYTNGRCILSAHKPIHTLSRNPVNGTASTECHSVPSSILRAHRYGLPLILRPDDVYLAVLSQVKFILLSRPAPSSKSEGTQSISKHLTMFSSAHEGAHGICLDLYTKSKHDMPTTKDIHANMKENVDDSKLSEILFPGFTTSTSDDDIVRFAVLLSAGQNSEYTHPAAAALGIPDVNLLGTIADWTLLLELLSQLTSLDRAVSRYLAIVTPLVKRFVQTFEAPDSDDVRSFWAQAVHCNPAMASARESTSFTGCPVQMFDEPERVRRPKGKLPNHFVKSSWAPAVPCKSATASPRNSSIYTGWMTAFCMFSTNPKRTADEVMDKLQNSEVAGLCFELDGVRYPRINHDEIPTMHVEAAMTILSPRPGKHGEELTLVWLLAGMRRVEMSGGNPKNACSDSESQSISGRIEMSPVASAAAWWIIGGLGDGQACKD